LNRRDTTSFPKRILLLGDSKLVTAMSVIGQIQ
jgi:hypothetical protein